MKSIKVIALSSVLVLAGIVGGATPANAAAGYCVGAPPTGDGLALTDVTFQNFSVSADNCYGLLGTNAPDNATVLGLFGPGTDNTYISAVNPTGPNGVAVNAHLNMVFALTPIDGFSNGMWSLQFKDPGAPSATFPYFFDIVLALEDQGPNPDAWALYYFAGESVGSTASINGNWNYPGDATIEKSMVFIRNSTPGGSLGSQGQPVIPEPASLLLLGSGLSAAAWRARRRKQAK